MSSSMKDVKLVARIHSLFVHYVKTHITVVNSVRSNSGLYISSFVLKFSYFTDFVRVLIKNGISTMWFDAPGHRVIVFSRLLRQKSDNHVRKNAKSNLKVFRISRVMKC